MGSYSATTLAEYEEIASHYPDRRATLLPALWLAQRDFGHISTQSMEYIAGLVGVSFPRVYEVVQFYTMYKTRPGGRFHLQVCQTLSCYLAGAPELIRCVKEKLGIEHGGCTQDGLFSYQHVECLGSCHTAPVVQINDDFHEGLSRERFERLLKELPATSPPS